LLLFVGDDWAEDRHDVELQNEAGRVLARAKLSADLAGMTRLHALVGEHVGDAEDVTVVVGIETDRGVWASALAAKLDWPAIARPLTTYSMLAP
jgi:hypothetical protein